MLSAEKTQAQTFRDADTKRLTFVANSHMIHGEERINEEPPMNKTELEILKNRLSGESLRELIAKSGVKKYRIARETGLTYRSLCYWEAGRTPSDKAAMVLGVYFGLIPPDQREIEDIKADLNRIRDRVNRLSAGAQND